MNEQNEDFNLNLANIRTPDTLQDETLRRARAAFAKSEPGWLAIYGRFVEIPALVLVSVVYIAWALETAGAALAGT